MAELTNLETKLGEVIGLAMAAQDATKKVGKLVEREGGGDPQRHLHDTMEGSIRLAAEEDPHETS